MKKRIHFICSLAIILSLSLATTGGYAQDTDQEFIPYSGQEGKDVVWVPTPQKLVDTMLGLAKVTSADYVIDLGSGDGRLVITASKRGATALGIEYNPDMVALARRIAAEEGANVKFEQADIFEYDFSKATVVTLFLLPDLNVRLRPIILDMKPGTRIVSNTFDMSEWEPDQTIDITDPENWITAHLWIVPAKIDGTWKLEGGEIHITQDFQYITGTLVLENEKVEIIGKLEGDKVSFSAGNVEFLGTVKGNTMSGARVGGGAWSATR